jgi:peptidoglycan/xylan/chitin deacetylase (PgdA/CDA1 family)
MARLPILMYHNVDKYNNKSKGLTISEQKLEQQLRYLSTNNFTTYHLAQLENMLSIPLKSIVITFDDVTTNQLLYAVPLLKKYNLKATFFIPFAYIGKSDLWNEGSESIMDMDQLLSLDNDTIELGYHSYQHRNYAGLNDDEIAADFEQCNEIILQTGLNVYPAVAYPYGKYPRKEPAKSQFKKQLEKSGIKMGLKIGNRVNKFPFPDKYEIRRIDIKGEDGLFKFRLKLKFGKLKLF